MTPNRIDGAFTPSVAPLENPGHHVLDASQNELLPI